MSSNACTLRLRKCSVKAAMLLPTLRAIQVNFDISKERDAAFLMAVESLVPKTNCLSLCFSSDPTLLSREPTAERLLHVIPTLYFQFFFLGWVVGNTLQPYMRLQMAILKDHFRFCLPN